MAAQTNERGCGQTELTVRIAMRLCVVVAEEEAADQAGRCRHLLSVGRREDETSAPPCLGIFSITNVASCAYSMSARSISVAASVLPRGLLAAGPLPAPDASALPSRRAARRPVDGHGRRFDGSWTGTVRHATAVILLVETTEYVQKLWPKDPSTRRRPFLTGTAVKTTVEGPDRTGRGTRRAVPSNRRDGHGNIRPCQAVGYSEG
ncbi:hypothetical protein DFH09DRAFT_1467591 [Mycena vulgaris]|nr:hypothetical protein DFH09DRAFT_1467591 [Mycena vulgaris]